MFSHANLAIFTKNGTLLPINFKSEIIVAINDDYDGQAIFYPVLEALEDGTGSHIAGYKKVYGGRFLDNSKTERKFAIISGKKIDYRTFNVQYEPVKMNTSADDKDVKPLYTITEISNAYGENNPLSDSELTFPNITFTQKLIFDKVSTELFETEFLYVMGESTDPVTGKKIYKKISSLAYESDDVMSWVNRYRLLFFIDCRSQQDFRLFTVTGDEAIWSDRAELNLLDNIVTVSDGTAADYPMGWTGDESAKNGTPRVDIAFSGENEGVYRQSLHICLLDTYVTDKHDIPQIIPIGEIELIAEAEGEDERYRTMFTNFGIPDPKYFDYVYKNSYIDDDKPDYLSINRHSKEMFLEYDKIFPYVGTYKALINAVHLLGYDDIFFKEWYKVLDVSDEIPRGYIAYDMSYKNSGHNATLAALPLEKRIHLRKKNWLSMLYSLNRELYGAPDEYDFPYVEELFEYRMEDSLLKLIALREWLEKYVLALNCRIIDIGGEGVYFERYAVNTYGGIRTNIEHVAGLNVIPSISDASLSDTVVLEDSSAFITLKAVARMEEQRISDLKNLRFEDFCDGVITEDGVYHTYDGSTEGRYVGTVFAGYNGRFTGKINAVSTVKDFIIGEDGFISEESPRLIISGNEMSFIPEDIVFKEKNAAFKRMPVISLERAVLRSLTDTWEKPIKYIVYPENNLDTGVSYFIENKVSKEKVGSFDYVYLVPPTYEEDDEAVTITRKNSINPDTPNQSTHNKKKHYNFKSDFDSSNNVIKEYTSDDTTYGFRFSANNAYEIPLICIQGYSLKRPVQMELPVATEYCIDILKGKLIFDDFEHGRKIYIIFDTDESGNRSIAVKFSYFTEEFDMCRYRDNDGYVFNHFTEGNEYSSFIELYDEDSNRAVEFDLLKSIKVYNSGEFKVNLSIRDIYGEIYSADAFNTAKVITMQPLITAYTNEAQSNNEYAREGKQIDASVLTDAYDEFCYFWYKVKYPVINAYKSDTSDNVTYPVCPYSGDNPSNGMIAHYGNFSDKFKVVAYDKFIMHDDRIDWNYYLILNRQNRYKNTRIVEKNDKGALNELYSGDIHKGVYNMAHTCDRLFADADRLHSENLDVTVMFYNEVGAFPVLQLPGKILNAKALDNLQVGSALQEHQSEPYGYYEDEYHLLISYDITDCYVYTPTDDRQSITTIIDSSGNAYKALTFMQDGIEWLVKSVFSEGYGSLWEYDFIPTRMSEKTIMGKKYAYSAVDASYTDPTSVTGYWWTDDEWEIKEFEDLPWISGWLTYKGSPVMHYTDALTGEEFECRVPAGIKGDTLMFRVPSYDPSFGDNAAFSPYYAIKPKTLLDIIPEVIEDPNISVYVYPYWHCEVNIIGVSENRVYVQFENSKYKFPKAFKQGELVKLIWQTGDKKAMLTNDISQSSYKVVGYDELGFVLILEGEINGSYAVNLNKKYAYADLRNVSGRYGITKEDWDPKEYEDMPFVDGKEGWITGWLTLDGSSLFRHEYDPELSFYKDHPELYRDGSVGSKHTHVFRIPAGMYVSDDSSDNATLIRYRVYSHNDLTCPYANPSNRNEGIDPHGMFSPHYYSFNSAVDASLFISYAYNAFSDYKMTVSESNTDIKTVKVSHPASVLYDKLTYFIDDTFKATYRTFDKDNGILYWMNSSDGTPLICENNVYSYNCPVTTYEKTPFTAFNIDYKDIPEDNRQTILWRVFKSLDAKEKTLLFESWNNCLFLDITHPGIYDIEVNEFDKYGNRSIHMYEGAYRILREEVDAPTVYTVNATSELTEGTGDYGYVTGGGNYEEGTICILKATVYDGYEFVGWTIDDTFIETGKTLMFIISSSCSIKGKFRPIKYKLSVSSVDSDMGDVSICVKNPDGTFEPIADDSITEYEYPYGTVFELFAIPNSYEEYSEIKYKFVKWQCNGDDISNSDNCIFTLTEDSSILALFTDKTFKLSATSNDSNYGIAEVSKQVCLPGEDCTFTAIINSSENYIFEGWYESDMLVSDSSLYYIEHVLKDYNLVARFKVKPVQQCTINLAYSPLNASQYYGIEVNGNSGLSYTGPFGSVVSLKCVEIGTLAPIYTFSGWYTGNTRISESMSCNYTLRLPSESITAKFVGIKYTVHGEIDNLSYGTVISDVSVNAFRTAYIYVQCTQLYEIDIDSTTVSGTYGSFSMIDKTGDPYKYKFKISNVRSDISINFAFKIRNEYMPFFILTGTDAAIGIKQLSDSVYYNCQIEGETTVNALIPDTLINLPAGKKLYIWAQQVKSKVIVARNAGNASTPFIVNDIVNDTPVNYAIGGNIISLLLPNMISGTYVKYSERAFTGSNNECFKNLFKDSLVTDAFDLSLPVNTMAGCYESMFENSAIIVSPVLKAKQPAAYSYRRMFKNCSYLHDIYTCQENWNITEDLAASDERMDGVPTAFWVQGNLPTSGYFHKTLYLDAVYNDNSALYCFIPNNWTIKNDL